MTPKDRKTRKALLMMRAFLETVTIPIEKLKPLHKAINDALRK